MCNFKIKIGPNALIKLRSENLWKLRTAIIKLIDLWDCSLLFATKKTSFRFFFFHKTRAKTQQVLPEHTALYRYDEWMEQEINDENLEVN